MPSIKKQYPYVGINEESGTVFMFLKKGNGIYLYSTQKDMCGRMNKDGDIDESKFKIYNGRISFNHDEYLFLSSTNASICKIVGSEIHFSMEVPEKKIREKCKKIWNNPEGYSDYKNGSDAAYYNFLKYLWVQYPDGKELRLTDIAES